MKSRLVIATCLASCSFQLFATAGEAADKGDWRIGALAGQVSLLGDVGNDDPNGVGYGMTGGYYIDENLALEASYLSSKHTCVGHNDLSFGAEYYLGDYLAAYPSLSAGVSFLSNKIKTINSTGDAFAFYVGTGFDFEVSERFTVGLNARFQKAFEGKTQINGVNVTTVDDSMTVMLRFLYRFEANESM